MQSMVDMQDLFVKRVAPYSMVRRDSSCPLEALLPAQASYLRQLANTHLAQIK